MTLKEFKSKGFKIVYSYDVGFIVMRNEVIEYVPHYFANMFQDETYAHTEIMIEYLEREGIKYGN